MTDKKGKFSCDICNYHGARNAHLTKHLSSTKHALNCQPIPNDPNCKFQCKQCNKKYKGLSGLWQHNKKCVPVVIVPIMENVVVNSTNKIPNISEIIIELKKQQEQAIAVHTETLVVLKKINESNVELKKTNVELKKSIEALTDEVHSRQIVPSNVNNITAVMNNTNNININVFLNETCKNAINLDSFIKNIMFELADSKLMIGSYVEGTCSILQKNLNGLPLNKRPMHCMEGEDPNQQLMHIRQDDKWNIGTYVNWLEQIFSDDDDDVVDKNPIYYALKTIDDEKLKYLGYNFYQNEEYKKQHSRLHREISRPDLKRIVYDRLLKMITVEPNT